MSDYCTICLDEESIEPITLTSCNHGFHTSCLDNWFKTNNISCPMCRSYLEVPTYIKKENEDTRNESWRTGFIVGMFVAYTLFYLNPAFLTLSNEKEDMYEKIMAIAIIMIYITASLLKYLENMRGFTPLTCVMKMILIAKIILTTSMVVHNPETSYESKLFATFGMEFKIKDYFEEYPIIINFFELSRIVTITLAVAYDICKLTQNQNLDRILTRIRTRIINF
jgi:hypothetical protein